MREPSGPEYVAYSARNRAQLSVSPRDKDLDKVVSDTYVLQHHARAIRTRICGVFRAQQSTIVSWST
jgi:pSer/pThr/pTyr-binding forkhead associated (FHA) protein